MRNSTIVFLIFLLNLILLVTEIFSLDSNCPMKSDSTRSKQTGSFYTGIYPNLFSDLLAISDSQVNARIDSAFSQLFYGDDHTQRVYYPVEPDMAYIEDIGNQDVRTEGMSYGMMIAVQLNKKSEFDHLWKWAKTFMQHQAGASKDFFAWHCKTNGSKLSENSASDGEEWFVMALFFASARWGDGEGIYNYKAEAQKILDAMLSKAESSDQAGVITNMFNKQEKQVVFVPVGNADDFTDPSYHLPHFYELWARWADKNKDFWRDAADASRQFLRRAVHSQTGLAPDYARFDGSPMATPWGGGHKDFRFDAWRVAMNVAVDYAWFAKDDWAIEQSNRLLHFFYSQGIEKYVNQYTLDGKPLSNDRSAGLIAMNAVAALASTNENRKEFVKELWNLPVPSGHWRYYDGMLYLMAMLQVSGNFKIYDIMSKPVPACSESKN
jgi:oligosaccharide reducing-end xylanase